MPAGNRPFAISGICIDKNVKAQLHNQKLISAYFACKSSNHPIFQHATQKIYIRLDQAFYRHKK